MLCHECGQRSDWVGDGADWRRAGGDGATLPLLVCEECGNRQRPR